MGDATQFQGVIGRYRSESEAWWPEPVRAPAGAPNVLVVILDDVGFAQLGCFGSDIATPNIDALAARGVRYSNFHTTALCSPTRACVLTGRNHHAAGMGRITDLATGFPGYDALIPPSVGMLPEMLVPRGYAAYAVGKWHLTPEEHMHLASSRETWPLGRGFERWYGFFGGETNQFAPALLHDSHRVPPPRSADDGYHLSEDLADRAIEFVGDLRQVDPDKPFFLYFATGACHSPHQSPAEWIEREKGRFDQGWDVWRNETFARQMEMGLLPAHTELSPRPDWVPAWDSLSADEQRLYARYMECFSAFLSHADAQIGRVLGFLDETGDLDDTLVLLLSDNGASSEGGPTGSVNDARPWNLAERNLDEALAKIDDIGGPYIHNNYPWGWTVAGNTPFRRWKREVHEGGVCDPLVVSWPNGLAGSVAGSVRRQYVHAVDLLPTILEAAGVEVPTSIAGIAQIPVDGVSFRTTLDDPDAAEIRTTQYFEMFGCRAIYHDGWKAVTYVSMMDGDVASDDDAWELFDLGADPSECHDRAADEPDRLASMIELWWAEAEANHVLPIDSMPFFEAIERAKPTPARGRYVYYPGTGPVDEPAAVNVRNRDHSVTASVSLPAGSAVTGGSAGADSSAAAGDRDGSGRAQGVIISQGSGLGGWVLYLADGRLHYAHNFVGLELSSVTSSLVIPTGDHTVGMRFDKRDQRSMAGTVTLVIDGADDASVEVPRFTPTRWSITGDGLTIGRSMSLPVVVDYSSPFTFSGTIHRVEVLVAGEPVIDHRAEAELSIRAQ